MAVLKAYFNSAKDNEAPWTRNPVSNSEALKLTLPNMSALSTTLPP